MNCKKVIFGFLVLVFFAGMAVSGGRDYMWRSLTSLEGELLIKGKRLIENGKMVEAAEVFKEMVRRKPGYIGPYFYLANIYSEVGEYREAAAICVETIRRFPLEMRRMAAPGFKNGVYSQIYYILGIANFKLNRFEESVKAFQKIVESYNYKAPHSYWLKLNTANPLTADAFYASVHYNLGSAYLLLGNKGAALVQYKMLKELDREMGEKLYHLINR